MNYQADGIVVEVQPGPPTRVVVTISRARPSKVGMSMVLDDGSAAKLLTDLVTALRSVREENKAALDRTLGSIEPTLAETDEPARPPDPDAL